MSPDIQNCAKVSPSSREITLGARPIAESYSRKQGGGVMENVAEATVRMAATADDFASAIVGASDADLSRRPDAKNWSAKEIACHIRDVEELFMDRIKLILATEGARFAPVDPDPWVATRQYQRNDVQQALASFRAFREETLALLRGLTPEQWERGGTHITRGPLRITDIVLHAARHDDNHLDQLKRALKGQA
jgi:uncharacterized damage-inducible protein DinB